MAACQPQSGYKATKSNCKKQHTLSFRSAGRNMGRGESPADGRGPGSGDQPRGHLATPRTLVAQWGGVLCVTGAPVERSSVPGSRCSTVPTAKTQGYWVKLAGGVGATGGVRSWSRGHHPPKSLLLGLAWC